VSRERGGVWGWVGGGCGPSLLQRVGGTALSVCTRSHVLAAMAPTSSPHQPPTATPTNQRIKRHTSDATNAVLVPLLLRACDSNNPRAQEEVLRSVQRLAQEVQYDVLRGALVPKVGVRGWVVCVCWGGVIRVAAASFESWQAGGDRVVAWRRGGGA